MAEVLFTPKARQDLLELGDYVAVQLRNKAAARDLLRRLRSAAMSLADFPESGTPLDLPGVHVLYRYLVCGNHMIFYHLSGGTVWIDRVLYGRRDYLSILFGSQLHDDE